MLTIALLVENLVDKSTRPLEVGSDIPREFRSPHPFSRYNISDRMKEAFCMGVFSFLRIATLAAIAFLPLMSGCASSNLNTQSINAQPVEQLTVRFNADLTEHWGEYRLIRYDVTNGQCLWQVYTDGDLSTQGNMRLPDGGLQSVFAEVRRSLDAISAATTHPSNASSDLDDIRTYRLHLTYESQTGKQEATSAGTLGRIAMVMRKSPQILAVHEQLLRKLSDAYWFAHLDRVQIPESAPVENAQAQAR